MLDYNNEDRDFDQLRGKVLRNWDTTIIGTIADVVTVVDGHGHKVSSIVVVDDDDNEVRKMNVRKLEDGMSADTSTVMVKHSDDIEIVPNKASTLQFAKPTDDNNRFKYRVQPRKVKAARKDAEILEVLEF